MASDYGSDFSDGEVDIVNTLLDDLQAVRATSDSPATVLVTPGHVPALEASIEAARTPATPAAATSAFAKSPYGLSRGPYSPTSAHPARSWQHPPSDFLQLADSLVSPSPPGLAGEATFSTSQPDAAAKSGKTKRSSSKSPLQRFRSFPKKPLTVTDLTSGAWCELQYAYVLTRLPGGRKTRTAAMRGGSAVHQKLEDQVHTAVRVSVARKEEAFALRMWNVIQGLRTLRETGLTREFEVWGTIDGQLVNGVIDELSFTCPVDEMEPPMAEGLKPASPKGRQKKQTPMSMYLDPHRRQVYLLDTKTRGSNKLPTGAALRPTKLQLFLYHRMLSETAAGKLDLFLVMARYGLEPEARFSDAFMAQIGGLHDDIFDDADSESDGSEAPEDRRSGRASIDATPSLEPSLAGASDLMRYRCLSQLVPLLVEEVGLTFPQGADDIADLLSVQYRHREDGRVVGSTAFSADAESLDAYVTKYMQWWHGRREPEGVPIEESYKCGYCEFAESCEWRMGKEKEIYDRNRAKAAASTG